MVSLSDFERMSIDGGVRLSAKVAGGKEGDTLLWLELRPAEAALTPERGDPFVLPALLLAMQQSEDLRVECPVSERLAANLPDIAQVFAMMLRLRVPRVEVTEGVHDPRHAAGVLAGIRGGIDSFHILAENFIEARDARRRITHLVFDDANGTDDHHGLSQRRRGRVKHIAEELGLPLHHVSSNFADVIVLDRQQTRTARSAAFAYTFTGLCGTFLHATAGLGVDKAVIGAFDDMAYVDQTLLALFSTDQMTLFGPDIRLRRTDKTARIANLPLVQKNLDVCETTRWDGERVNCSHCASCRRTMVTLDCLGMLDAFDAVFDVARYRADRDEIVRGLVGTRNALDEDALQLALEHGLARDFRTRVKLAAPWLWLLDPRRSP